MKKTYLIWLVLVIFIAAPMYAQNDKTLKRPNDIGNGEYDEFKNSSFNTYEESNKLNQNLTHIDTEIKEYSGVMSTVSSDKLKGHYRALTSIKGEVEALSANLSKLDEKGKSLVSNASNVTPKTKSLQATSNTKKSVESLEHSRKTINSILSIVQTDTKLIADELKSRGEPIE